MSHPVGPEPDDITSAPLANQQPQTPPPGYAPIGSVPATKPLSSSAVTGFILSLLFFPAILGVIFSIIGITRTGANKLRGRGLAIAGTIIGLAATVTGIIIIAVLASATNTIVNDPQVNAAISALASPNATQQAATDNTIPGDGTFTVGTDVQPGTYVAPAMSGCYWQRLKDTSGDPEAIIANDIANGQVTVTIAATDGAFSTQGCGVFTKTG